MGFSGFIVSNYIYGIFLGVLCVILFITICNLNQEKQKALTKTFLQKKTKKRKAKKPKPKIVKETISEEKPKEIIIKEKEPEITKKGTSRFCGYYGESALKPFCKNCGEKI